MVQAQQQQGERDEGGSASGRSLLFNKYELGRLLGQGTFAKVYYARDLASNSPVAIKIIQKDQLRRHDPKLPDQILREISIMRLVRHPNIVDLREVLATKTRIFFVMEYVRGGELFSRVARGKIPEDQARKYFQQLISAVDFCHSRGVYHRDLKPENLLLDENGDLKVSDFGLSALPEQLRQDGLLHTQCGTPAYVAPEVLRKKGYDGAKADVWSSGVILFVLLAGFLPFQDENLMKMYRKIFKAEYQAPPWFSADARRLISRLLVADPEKRMSIQAIMKLPWFKCKLSRPVAFATPAPPTEPTEENLASPRSYNAFDLISTMSSGFDLSSLFEKNKRKKGTVFTSRRPAKAIVEALERAGRGLGFGVEKAKEYKVRLEGHVEGRKGKLAVTAEVFEVAPEVAVVEFCKNSGDTLEYVKFCEEDVRPGGEATEVPVEEFRNTAEFATGHPEAKKNFSQHRAHDRFDDYSFKNLARGSMDDRGEGKNTYKFNDFVNTKESVLSNARGATQTPEKTGLSQTAIIQPSHPPLEKNAVRNEPKTYNYNMSVEQERREASDPTSAHSVGDFFTKSTSFLGGFERNYVLPINQNYRQIGHAGLTTAAFLAALKMNKGAVPALKVAGVAGLLGGLIINPEIFNPLLSKPMYLKNS